MRTALYRTILLSTLLSAGAVSVASAQPSCGSGTGVSRVTWKGWDFCVTRMTNTTPQPNGSGMEISQVHFKGRLFLKRANIPVLNVKYATGGCGCYRDWFDSERAFSCAPADKWVDGSTKAGFCNGSTTAVQTVCDHPGTDAGTWTGIAAQDKGNYLKLTQQATAGWYRYIPVWEFYLNGTMRAGMDFSATTSSCVQSTHHHHAYWRMDFDVEGPLNDYVDYYYHDPESANWGAPTRVLTENNWIDSDGGGAPPLPAGRSHWRFGSVGSPVRVDVIRQRVDESANLDDAWDDGIVGDFPTFDGALLAYDANQMTDAATQGLSDCPIQLGSYDNDADVDDADVVLWVRSGVRHVGEGSNTSHTCFSSGPKIKVNVPKPPVDFDGNRVSNVTLYRNGAWLEFPVP